VVTVSSNAHKTGGMDFGDLMSEESYSSWRQYGRSKLANLMFALELDRRLRRAGAAAISVAVHPGYSATNLQFSGPGMARFGFLQEAVMWVANQVVAQSDEMGALPTLYAATAPGVKGGDYIGPDGVGEFRGHPTNVEPAGRAKKQDHWLRLWDVSEELTGVRYEALA
jgi:NAD(P)-dependent dehydrogenase (short-subunit alcohol dehydrogenase family)